MTGRSIQHYGVVKKIEKQTVIDFVHQSMSLEDALAVRVKYQHVNKSLSWIARNRPKILESLMDTLIPGTRSFWALCLVYEAYEKRVRKAVDSYYGDLAEKTREGIRRQKELEGCENEMMAV